MREAGVPTPDAVTETFTRPAGSLTGTTAESTPARIPNAWEATTFHAPRLCTETATVARVALVATARTARFR